MHHRTQDLIAAALAMLVLLAAAAPCQGQFKPTEARLSFVKGKVEIQRVGGALWTAGSLKMRVYPGDKVSSDTSAEAEITLDDGSVIKLKDKSLLVIEKMEKQKKPLTTITALRAVNGKVLGCIKKLATKESKFSVTTPTAVAGVRGTVFGVFVAGDSTELDVLKGEVALAGEQGGEVMVGEKMMSTAVKGGAARAPVALTAARIGMIMLWGGAAIKVGSLSAAAASTAWYATTPALIAASATAVAGTVAAIAIAGKKDNTTPAATPAPRIPNPPTFPGSQK
ncbi:MAG TPA: FecR domain-containing protein [Candidatus Edwardsbacteria bacterium]|nr:FecR domain-containing protein [Candidatus Edwardsbacteria bacterium]